MQSDLYFLCLHGSAHLDYVFKRPEGERLLLDPDLGFSHDVAYGTDNDAQELLLRAFTLQEARAARTQLFYAYSDYFSESDSPHITLVRIDRDDPISTFSFQQRLLRILPWDSPELREELSEMSSVRPSTRENGIRSFGSLFYRRHQIETPQRCYAVEAHRINPPAHVIARYGHWLEAASGPRARAERFGFVEWGTYWDREIENLMTSACRVLREDEAQAIATSLTKNANFREVRITSGTLNELDATEGLGVSSQQLFSQADAAQEEEVGFPHFLSVFPLDGGERQGEVRPAN